MPLFSPKHFVGFLMQWLIYENEYMYFYVNRPRDVQTETNAFLIFSKLGHKKSVRKILVGCIWLYCCWLYLVVLLLDGLVLFPTQQLRLYGDKVSVKGLKKPDCCLNYKIITTVLHGECFPQTMQVSSEL